MRAIYAPFWTVCSLPGLRRRTDCLDRRGHALLGLEDRSPGDQNIGAGLHHSRRGGRADASVCFEVAAQAARVQHLSQARDLGQRGFDELLAAKTRVHRHDEHLVYVAENLFDGHEWGRRVEHHAGLLVQLVDLLNRPV